MTTSGLVALTIAGFDPSSGAGVTADLKTMAAHGVYGVACITALTVQNTRRVRQVHPVPCAVVRSTLEELANDLDIRGVKIGMLANAELVNVVADFLSERKPAVTVLDPVLGSSSGTALLDKAGIRAMQQRLLPLVQVATPNLAEARALTGKQSANAAGEAMLELGPKAVVITDGEADPPRDLLFRSGAQPMEFKGRHIETHSTHGTGCAFSTALACELLLGGELEESVHIAKNYVERAIAAAYPIGKGRGPIEHLWPLFNPE